MAPPMSGDAVPTEGEIPYCEQRLRVIDVCHKMQAMGLIQGAVDAAAVSARVPGGFVVTSAGVAFEKMRPDQVVFMDLSGAYYGEHAPSPKWKVHCDVYNAKADAQAVIYAEPPYCSALACQRKGITAFHYMVAAAGGKEIKCTGYQTYGSDEFSKELIDAFGPRRAALIANHGMACCGPNLDKALWLANETECLAKQFITAMSAKLKPIVLDDLEMDMMLAKFASYGKQPDELKKLTAFQQKHAISAPPAKGEEPKSEAYGLPHLALRKKVIEVCLKMNEMGINQGSSGNVSARVPGGFVVTASGVPYHLMKPEQVVFLDMTPGYYGKYLPTSEWRMHYDIYKSIPEAEAIVHAHPTFCTALSTERRSIPAFHYEIAAAGGSEIKCTDYRTFGTQELSKEMIASLGDRRSCLLANHGMICYSKVDLDEALWLANKTEVLARQYVFALTSSQGTPPLLPEEEMSIVRAQSKTYAADEGAKLTAFEKKHALRKPRFAGGLCDCCEPPPNAPASFFRPPRQRWSGWKRALDEDELNCQALASIPDSYLSKEDDVVRLPNGARKKSAS
eukprot:TRINITY_DN14545_c0_g1_i1.p1 TRINITY_DN14545_c0_g1~~TRINITY_DN14545_c0_g1_i1.p1  ORF type:complete len:607 (+),score=139.76 TRINITY_DN14545_c0_g1_i1:128-1822(+)